MEGVTALLQELLVLGRILSLLRLLLKGSSADLRLRTLQSRLLGASAQSSDLLACLQLTGKIGGDNALLALCSLHSLLVTLLVKGSDSLRRRKTLLAH